MNKQLKYCRLDKVIVVTPEGKRQRQLYLNLERCIGKTGVVVECFAGIGDLLDTPILGRTTYYEIAIGLEKITIPEEMLRLVDKKSTTS